LLRQFRVRRRDLVEGRVVFGGVSDSLPKSLS
jgi:hypothetical protein